MLGVKGKRLQSDPLLWYYPRVMSTNTNTDPKELFAVGAHFGYSKTRRHPTAAPFVFTTKDKSDILDLEETARRLDAALEKVAAVAASGRQVLFVGGKPEIAAMVKSAAMRVGQPFVASRWIGGTLTNFKQIRRRIDRLEKLTQEKEKGDREKYTKLERLMLDREIEELEHRFGGLIEMRELPALVFIVDTGYEHIAVAESNDVHVPVVGLMSTDCDFSKVQFPIPANDSTIKSVRHFVDVVADAFSANKKTAAERTAEAK